MLLPIKILITIISLSSLAAQSLSPLFQNKIFASSLHNKKISLKGFFSNHKSSLHPKKLRLLLQKSRKTTFRLKNNSFFHLLPIVLHEKNIMSSSWSQITQLNKIGFSTNGKCKNLRQTAAIRQQEVKLEIRNGLFH